MTPRMLLSALMYVLNVLGWVFYGIRGQMVTAVICLASAGGFALGFVWSWRRSGAHAEHWLDRPFEE